MSNCKSFVSFFIALEVTIKALACIISFIYKNLIILNFKDLLSEGKSMLGCLTMILQECNFNNFVIININEIWGNVENNILIFFY